MIAPEFEPFWSAARPALDRARFYEAFAFGDSERMADELAQLVLAGVKRATASLAWTYEFEHKPRPKPGDLSIVTSGAGTPLCIIETTAVDEVAFDDVSAGSRAPRARATAASHTGSAPTPSSSRANARASGAGRIRACRCCASGSGWSTSRARQPFEPPPREDPTPCPPSTRSAPTRSPSARWRR